jgi:hypothetical protein
VSLQTVGHTVDPSGGVIWGVLAVQLQPPLLPPGEAATGATQAATSVGELLSHTLYESALSTCSAVVGSAYDSIVVLSSQ